MIRVRLNWPMFSGDPEVGLERHLDLHARHVDKGAAGPDRRVERGQFVVVGRDHGRPVLLDDIPRTAERGVHVGEDHTLRFELSFTLVVDDLGFVLRTDAGEELLLGFGMPRRSKVFLMSSGTSDQSRLFFSEARTK